MTSCSARCWRRSRPPSRGGLKADVVTQFGFDANGMIRWVKKLRDLGIEAPVRIGMAGPTNLTTLLKYAQRCGVKASARRH